jgi:ActR/RegA family two-component response regulator
LDPRTDTRSAWGSPARAPEWGGPVVRLLAVRVLLISEDRPYRTATATLLARRGAFVETAGTEAEAAALAESMRPDVLVYDLSAASLPGGPQARRPEAIRSRVLSVQASAPPGIVLVGEAQAQKGITVLDRWGEFGTLFEAIVEADLRRAPLISPPSGPPRLRIV